MDASSSWGRPSSGRLRAGGQEKHGAGHARAQRPPSLAWQPLRAGRQHQRRHRSSSPPSWLQRFNSSGNLRQQQQQQSEGLTLSQRHKNLKLLVLLHSRPAVPLMPPRSGKISQEWLVGHVMNTLTRIHQQSAAQGRSLEQHLRWMRVELMTLPDALSLAVQSMFDNVQNWLRMLLSLIMVLFLLR